ncbi:hypothetical protein PR202_ga10367 [Eleusine coracana subsp. coracana]|uniref:Exostosin GT47 domain-containing protein n=1 Tax=Eleusine coracana subsp. coracana TaxID=191504 RepID=A0AAV5C6H5_ELECO|nr:hypothetical protein PR202_ga10367 [Eleusine coracana subsp. coracana]
MFPLFLFLLMPSPPHLAGAAANTRTATATGLSSRRRPRHRGAMAASASCCRVAAVVSLFAPPIAPPGHASVRSASRTAVAVAPPRPSTVAVRDPANSASYRPSTPPPAARRRKREPSYRRMAPEEALRYAKKEIRDAEPVADYPDLYAPLFNNVSQFKRSYELMERILKVYIYQDGRRPIFHRPPLSGIYASEGWFMKLLKESRRHVVDDAAKAHLFYLPYSSQQLRLTLYVPESHNLRPLSAYLRNFVRGLAAKYPFWNRTRGADHFLVACHDWGPYTTTSHRDLRRNTIKALCNADTSEGIFTPGKDVSLPETTIRMPKRPLRYVGGLPYVAMHTCVKRLQRHFLWHARPVKYDLFHMILHSIWLSRVNQVEIEG